MKLSRFIFFYSSLLLLPVIFACKNLKDKNDFTGTYKVDKIISPDSVLSTRAEQALNWKLLLKDHNNFHLYGPGKNMVGYWNVEMKEASAYRLLFQSGSVLTYARFDGTNIYFDQPDKMLDSLFSRAVFTKSKK